MSLSDLQQGLVDNLAVAIAQEHGGQDAVNMARALLEEDSSTRLLVGVTEGAQKVVYYGQTMWGVKMYEFDADGVVLGSGSQVEECGHRDALERLVRANQAGLAWVHPRFEWSI